MNCIVIYNLKATIVCLVRKIISVLYWTNVVQIILYGSGYQFGNSSYVKLSKSWGCGKKVITKR